MIFFIQRNCETNKTKKNLDKDNSQNFSLHNFDEEKKYYSKISFSTKYNVFFSALFTFDRPYTTMKNNYRVHRCVCRNLKNQIIHQGGRRYYANKVYVLLSAQNLALVRTHFFLFACPGFLLGSYLNRVNLDYNNYVQSLISIELDPNLLIHILSTMVFNNCFAFILC